MVRINQRHNYCGIATKSNVTDLQVMKQATLVSLFQCSFTDETPRHGLYPLGPGLGAGLTAELHLVADATSTREAFPMRCIIKWSLCMLTSECLHGRTQNSNPVTGWFGNKSPKTWAFPSFCSAYIMLYVTSTRGTEVQQILWLKQALNRATTLW